MTSEIDYRIQHNHLRLKRYKIFNWKKYFLTTFAFLLLLDVFMFVVVPQNLTHSELLVQLAISLWVMLLVCAIYTPLIKMWYGRQQKKVKAQIQDLRELKKLKRKRKKL